MKSAFCCSWMLPFILAVVVGPACAGQEWWVETSALGGVLEGPAHDSPPAVCIKTPSLFHPYLNPTPMNPDGTPADCEHLGNMADALIPIILRPGGADIIGRGEAKGWIFNTNTITGRYKVLHHTVLWIPNLVLQAQASLEPVPPGEFAQAGTAINLYIDDVKCPRGFAGYNLAVKLERTALLFPGAGGTDSAGLHVITADAVDRTDNSWDLSTPEHTLITTPLKRGCAGFSVLIALTVSQYDQGTAFGELLPADVLEDSIPAPEFTFLPDPSGSIKMVPLGNAPGSPSQEFDKQLLAGWYANSSDAIEGFELLPGGTLKAPIIDPHDTLHYTAPQGINNAGTIVGTYENKTPVGVKGPLDTFHGFIRTANGKFTTYDFGKGLSTSIAGINNHGDMTGGFGNNIVVNQGFLLPKGGKPTTFGVSGLATYPQSINGSDAVVGVYVDKNGADHGFEWTPEGGLVPFDYPGAAGTVAAGINDAGTIDGYFTDASGRQHGFYGTPFGWLRQYDLAGVADLLPSGISDFGAVTGSANKGDGVLHGFVAQLCAADRSGAISVTPGKIALDKRLGEYVQKVSLKNSGTAAIPGPLYLLFKNLPDGVFPANAGGFSTCVAPQAPYIAVVPSGSRLATGATVSVSVDFFNASKQTITYTPAVAAGSRV